MFNKIRLKEILAEYKKVFVQQQWPNEKYKWEAVQCFQENWDINSADFAQMLKKSLAKTDNLLRSANNFPKGDYRFCGGCTRSGPFNVYGII